MRTVILDGRGIRDRKELHQWLEKAFSFPEWYGNNLDALFDCLTDVAEDTEICLRYPDALKEQLGDYAERLTVVLGAAAAENPHISYVIIDKTGGTC